MLMKKSFRRSELMRSAVPNFACPRELAMELQPIKFDWTQGALAEGLRLYDAGEFFAAHEAWESVWLGSQEPEKTFLQGLIQVTAAFHHLQRNNPLGTTLLLQAALRRLAGYPACFGGT